MHNISLPFFQLLVKKPSRPHLILTKKTCQGPQSSILNKNLNENDDVDDDSYKFFGKKKRKEMRVSKFWGWGRNRGFSLEYLLMKTD